MASGVDYTWDFFMAHAGADKDSAESLYSLLAGDARVFLDSKCLKLGDDWDRELTRAQQTSRVTIVLVSSNTNKAYYEREEIAAAIAMSREDEQRHRIVPVYLNSSASLSKDIPYGLRLKHGLSVGNSGNLDTVANQLVDLLRQLTTATLSSENSEMRASTPLTGQYDTAAIRLLLRNALSDEELTEFCTDYFPKVYEQFATGMSKPQKIQRLIEYCSRHREIAKLLDLLKQANPVAFSEDEGG